MSEPFLAEIKIVGFNFPPRGWAFCDGQILPIQQNQSLYSLLGSTYGGDGQTTFGLPELRGRTPVHKGSGISLGQKAGEESVLLSATQIPAHDHVVQASSQAGNQNHVMNNIPAQANNLYHGATNLTALPDGTVASTGSSQRHENMQPYLTLNFCIALQGLFPSRS